VGRFSGDGSIVLAITGGERLYADMGHFGKSPIRFAWFSFVLPALVLNYFGQGALLLHNPQAVENPFYLLAPAWHWCHGASGYRCNGYRLTSRHIGAFSIAHHRCKWASCRA